MVLDDEALTARALVTRYGSMLGLSPKSRKALGVELIGIGAAAEPSAERSPYFDFD